MTVANWNFGDLLNTGGEKVFPEEVEEAPKRQPGVEDAVVLGVTDPQRGYRAGAVLAAEHLG